MFVRRFTNGIVLFIRKETNNRICCLSTELPERKVVGSRIFSWTLNSLFSSFSLVGSVTTNSTFHFCFFNCLARARDWFSHPKIKIFRSASKVPSGLKCTSPTSCNAHLKRGRTNNFIQYDHRYQDGCKLAAPIREGGCNDRSQTKANACLGYIRHPRYF